MRSDEGGIDTSAMGSRSISRSRTLFALFLFTLAICAAQLAFWIADFNPYGRFSIPMAPSTALLLGVLSAILLLRDRRPFKSRFGPWSLSILSFLSLAYVGVLAFAPRLAGDAIDIAALFAPHSTIRFESIPLGRISPLAGAIIAALLLCDLLRYLPRAVLVARFLFLSSSAVSVTSLFGYLFGIPFLYKSGVIPISLPSSVALVAACISLLLSTEDLRAFFSAYFGRSIRAQLLRVFVPFCLVSVFLASWVQAIVPDSMLNPAIVAAITVVLMLTATALIVIRFSGRIGERLDRTLEELKTTETSLHKVGWTPLSRHIFKKISVIDFIYQASQT